MIALPARDRGAPVQPTSFLLHLALAAMAIAQPLYSVTGTNLNFFVAWRTSGPEFAAWILLIYLVPPVLTHLVAWLGFRLHRGLGLALAFIVFSSYIWLAVTGVFRQLARQAPYIPISSGIVGIALPALALGLAWLLLSKPGLRGAVRLLGMLTIAFPALMLFRGYELGVIRLSKVPPPPTIEMAGRPNIVFIVFDELPLTTILDGEGMIDKEKFPNFHRLSQNSTWFADARSVSGETEAAVPAIMAGRLRKGVPATYAIYPQNIFYTLGASYNVLDLQIITNLNPFAQSGNDPDSSFTERTRGIARDIAIIYGHIAALQRFGAELPPIDRQHNRFGEDVATSPHGIAHHQRFMAALGGAQQPFLAVYHNIYPHNAWNHYPSGKPYPLSRWGDYISLDRKITRLGSDDARVMHDYQAHLLQSMHADKLLGEAIARLKSTGAYDNSMIWVVADHGVSLWPGEWPRRPNVSHRPDISAVPLLVKLPGQSDARVALGEAKTIDVYPTILDQLGLTRPADLQGTSLLNAIRTAAPAATVTATAHRADPTLKRRIHWFGTGTSSADLYGFGEFRDYIGRPVSAFKSTLMPDATAQILGPNGVRRTAVPDSERIDVRLSGGQQDGETRNVLVALDDRFCGAARTTDLEVNDEANTFTLLLAEECLGSVRKRELRVFVVDAFGQLAEMPVDKTSADRVVAEISTMIGGLKAPEVTRQQRMTLAELRESGIAVPEILTDDGELAGPWGEFAVTQDRLEWVIDFHSVSEDACTTLLLGVNRLPGVARIATTSDSKDEMAAPAPPEEIKQSCSDARQGFVRIIVSDRAGANKPAARQVSPSEVVAAAAQLVGALKQSGIRTNGRTELRTLREAGVAVPDVLVEKNRLSLPWGEVGIQKEGRRWVIDLYSVPNAVCTAVLLGINDMPAVAKAATTEASKDETNIPISADFAAQNCRHPQTDVVRIITTE